MPHALETLFRPRSLAIIGASRNPNKWGSWALQHTVDQGFTGPIFGINPSATPEDAAPPTRLLSSLDAMDDPIDSVMIALPRDKVLPALEACAERGVKNVILPATGYGEVDEAGRHAQDDLLAVARDGGIRLLGPNCFGLHSTPGGVNLTPWDIPAGPIGLASQSGNVAVALHEQARWIRSGFSACVGIGNQVDVGFGEILEYFAQDDATEAVAIYVEGLTPPHLDAFVAGLGACRDAGKVVAAIKAGRTERSAAAAATHTGSLAADTRVWRSVLRDHGAVVVDSPEQMMDVLQVGVRMSPIGAGVVVMADGGGDTVLAADAVEEAGFTLAHLSDATCAALDPLIPPAAPRVDGRNPLTLDTPGGVEDDPMLLARVVEVLREDPAVDAIVIGGVFGGYGYLRERENEAGDALVRLHAEAGPPIAVQSAYAWSDQEPVERLKVGGVAVYSSLDRLLAAMGARRIDAADAIAPTAATREATTARQLPVPEAAELLGAAGIVLPEIVVVQPTEDLTTAVEHVGLPAVLKLADPDITHKSDVGGVRLNLRTADDVSVAALELWETFPSSPLVLMPMARPGLEVLVGLHQDPLFGPVVALGRGGVWTEIEDDVVLLRAPLTPERVRRALAELRCAPMLFGARGQAPRDIDALVELACRLGDLGVAEPELEIDLNPVLLYEHGYTPVDLRIVTTSPHDRVPS